MNTKFTAAAALLVLAAASSAHAQTIAALRARMNGICGKLPAGDPARAACTGFLVKA